MLPRPLACRLKQLQFFQHPINTPPSSHKNPTTLAQPRARLLQNNQLECCKNKDGTKLRRGNLQGGESRIGARGLESRDQIECEADGPVIYLMRPRGDRTGNPSRERERGKVSCRVGIDRGRTENMTAGGYRFAFRGAQVRVPAEPGPTGLRVL
jgi:hypothetical protein